MNRQNFLYQLLAYAAVVPFLLGTYYTWCGPMEKIIHAGQVFSLYSTALLSFLIGSWWERSALQNQAWKNRVLVIITIYALVVGGLWFSGYLPLTILVLGIGYVALWLQGFNTSTEGHVGLYPMIKTLLTLTTFVCHLLVAMQIYTL